MWFDDFSDILTADRRLDELTTWRIGGRARWFFEPDSAERTAALVKRITAEGLPFRVLGGGANVLIDDGAHEMPYIHLRRMKDLRIEDDVVHVDGGVSFPTLVRDLVHRGFEGLEVLAGIPGMMGGICAMNAGGRLGEVAEHVVSIDFAGADGSLKTLARDELGFGYRRTALPPGVITRVRLRLRPAADPAACRRRLGEILKRKSATQPTDAHSAGCVFANPEGDSAGRLIESLGLKGSRIGGCEVSPLHANFIVNTDGGCFADAVRLIERVEDEVLRRTGICLRREVRLWPRAKA